MHRIPRIFLSDKKSAAAVGGGDSSFKTKPRRRLERRNAMKNIDYELPSTSSSSSSSSSDDYLFSSPSASDSPSPSPSPSVSRAHLSRSIDVCSLDKQTSFRIEGNCPGEFEIICRSLGLSGPEDFCIPAEAWEDMKVRSSSSDVLPRLSRFNYDGGGGGNGSSDAGKVSDVASLKDGRSNLGCFRDSTASPRVNDAMKGNIEGSHSRFSEAALTSPRCGSETLSSGSKLGDVIGATHGVVNKDKRDCWQYYRESDSVLIVNEGGSDLICGELDGDEVSGCCKIKGVRPPRLAPPPAMSLPPIDSGCSTWDILKSFAPDDDINEGTSRSEVCEVVNSEDVKGGQRDEDEGDEVDLEEIRYGVESRRTSGESGLLSESCSFTTTSNDDDTSSTTTEPLSSNISPNGRFRRVITYWDKGELLGRGTFGSVYEGIADGGFFFAVKEVSLLDQGEEARQSIYQLEQEIALLSQFEHDNIVQYYGTDKDESKLYIFLELVTKGSLLSLYQKYHLRDSQVSAYTRQILHGLKYLHDRNVVHRDIKCANILVDASGSVKLADFGLAKATKLNDVKSCKGTALWMAPEVVNRRNQGYGLAADIWSLGCTVLEMLTRQFPYSHLECQMQALFRIGRGEPPRVPESLSRDARDFILQCLQVNPNSRPTAAQLLDHPFVQRSLPLSGSASPYHPSRRS